MPRKPKTDLTGEKSKEQLLREIYNDSFQVKNTSMNIMRNVAKDIDYNNKSEVLTILPLIQKQMDIINKTNETLLEIERRING